MTNQRFRNVYLDNHSHFCTASIVKRLPLLADEALCRCILGSWDRQRKRWNVRVEGFVIMPDHIHVLVQGAGDAVRKFMQYSLAETSREIRRAIQLQARAGDPVARRQLDTLVERGNGPAQAKVWKERFRCVPLDDQRAVLQKLDYMHLNPVKAGLVPEAAQWKWSSHSCYQDGDCVFRVDELAATR